MKHIICSLILGIVLSFVVFAPISFSPEAEAQCGVASMYWVGDTACRHGRACGGQPGTATASGIPLDDHGFTIAHRGLPFGSKVMIQRGDREVEATVTDRGPFFLNRIADLTLAIASFLGISREQGIGKVCINYPDGTPVPQSMASTWHPKKHHVKKKHRHHIPKKNYQKIVEIFPDIA